MMLKFKYIVLILSVVFMAFSINQLKDNVLDIGLKPYSNITADKIIGEEEFLLDVKNKTNVFLLHSAEIGSGYVEFKMTDNNNKVVTEYKLSSDDFVKKVIRLEKGTYSCNISREIIKNRESFRLYFDKRYITQQYLKKDYNTENSGL